MRVLKFRAWDKTRKRILDRVLAGPGDPYSTVWIEEDKQWVNFDQFCGDIMQYTGLKDKNGVEIYEGDIVRISEYSDNIMNAVVTWGYFNDCCVEGETWLVFPDEYQPALYHYLDCAEVIGNIYEHPGLLPNEPLQGEGE